MSPKMSVCYEKMRIARVLARVSMVELAQRSGVSRTQISEMERGVVDCSVGRLCMLAKALGKKPEELYECMDGGDK